jgi:beta-mannosidase
VVPAGLRPPARQPLAARWRLCAAEPGAPAPAHGWEEIAAPTTVAAALRDAGRWSLDGAPLDFDSQDWWFAATFDAPAAGLVLGLDGLATLADVTLNGEPLLQSRSMFQAHVLHLQGLRERGNELLVRCGSVQADLGKRRPRPRWKTPMVAHQQLRWMRTTLLGRTPGWSPPAAPVGPWRDVWTCAPADAIGARVRARLEDGRGIADLDLQAHPAWSSTIESADLVLRAPDGREMSAALGAPSQGLRRATVVVERPALWWPHTHGEPALHEAVLRVQRKDGRREDIALGRCGFRTVHVDTTGGRFAVQVNGERVFCRGAGWTPLDPVSLRSTREQCRAALRQVRSAGMNMLRLAGTLVPEEDHFYDACDELGVLVWQDFPFASMDYPFDDAGFAALAAEDCVQFARRLSSHACVAVLCGNSEVEQQAAMWGAARELWQPAFFHDRLPSLCAEHAPHVQYWPSSAHGGAFPHQADAGTTSYYGVGAYERPLDDARSSGLSFATECLAFAAIPSPDTLQRLPGGSATRVHHPQWKARSPRDLGAGWDFDDVRDHYVQLLCGAEPARLRHADHDRYLALGRLAVAHAMEASFGEWRRPGSSCGGALLLFLRDLWAGAGWGVLDDAGGAKSAWHALHRALQPLGLSVTDEGGNGLALHALNDTAQPRELLLELGAWRDGDVRVAAGRKTLQLPPRGGVSVSAIDLLDHFMDLNHAWRFGPPACDIVQARLLDGEQEVAQAFHFPIGLEPLLSARRDIGWSVEASVDGGAATLVVRSRHAAIGVHADVPGWRVLDGDDHFHLAPGAARRMRFARSRPGAGFCGSVHALNALASAVVEATE